MLGLVGQLTQADYSIVTGMKIITYYWTKGEWTERKVGTFHRDSDLFSFVIGQMEKRRNFSQS